MHVIFVPYVPVAVNCVAVVCGYFSSIRSNVKNAFLSIYTAPQQISLRRIIFDDPA